MRWVWRAESGAFKVEYAALVMVVATILVAVLAAGMPTRVSDFMTTAMCRITGNEECAKGGDGDNPPQADGDGSDNGDGGQDGDGSDGGADGANSTYDPYAAQEIEDAQSELESAQNAQKKAQSEYDKLDEELMNLLLDLMGVEDARKCVTEGDIVACILTIVSFTPRGARGSRR